MPMREPTATTRALVVEDDPNIVDLIRSNLSIRGAGTKSTGRTSRRRPGNNRHGQNVAQSVKFW